MILIINKDSDTADAWTVNAAQVTYVLEMRGSIVRTDVKVRGSNREVEGQTGLPQSACLLIAPMAQPVRRTAAK